MSQYRYSAYGLTLRSSIELPALSVAGTTADADVHLDVASDALPPHTSRRVGANASGDAFGVRFDHPPDASFWVHHGRHIVVDVAAGVDMATTKALITGSCLAAVLHQRGYLPLHGSVVTDGEACVAFVGARGSGKSTMAAFLAGHGYAVMADDICAIAFDADGPVVWPSGQGQLLRPDAAAYFGTAGRAVERVDGCKVAVPIGAEILGDAKPLTAVFVLSYGNGVGIEHLDTPTAVGALLANTFRPRFVSALGDQRGHLERCAQLLATVPVYSLTRPCDLSRLPDVQVALEQRFFEQPQSTQSCQR